jgi:hypothetical protein
MSAARIRRGLTLIDLISLLGIVLFLLAELAPFVFPLFRLRRREESQNNLHQIAIAVHGFHDTCGWLPPIVGSARGEEKTEKNWSPFIFQE